MKKQLFSILTATAMTLSAMPFTAVAEYQDSNSAVITAEDQSETYYWIFYKNIDMTDIESKAEEKREEYIYSLYEQDLTQREFERLSTEYYISVRQELLKKSYAEQTEKILNEIGVNPETAFCSTCSSTIVCPLNDKQFEKAKKCEVITDISVYTAPKIEGTSDNKNETAYWIFYKNIDMTDIESKAEEKREEYIYSLYEQDLTQNELERLSTEYYASVRQELLKEAYAEKSEIVVKELGIDSSKAFCSMFAPTIIATLTEEQKLIAEKSELIESISVYTPVDIQPTDDKKTYSTKEKFINIITAGKDITELLGENIKVDAELNCKKDDAVFDYFVIYGIENDKKINDVINRLSSNPDVKVMISPVISKSGTFFSISVENIATQHEIQGVAFVDNEYPCWISPQTIESFTSTYDFNPLKYIIKLGDANCDGNVNMADAVLIMQSLANPNKYGINGTDETHITSLGEKNGDMDGNGLTNADALEIQKMLLKIS